MSGKNPDSNSAHSRAVQALSDARQHVRKYRFDLERAAVPDDQILVSTDYPDHPQKNAHAAVMDYYEEINQVEYTLMVDDLWSETLTDASGSEITTTVPKNDVVEVTVDERTGVDNLTPDLDEIPTREETVSLETLAYKWAGRTVTVRATINSPYRSEDTRSKTIRVWLPPKLIKAVYAQLNDCLSKIGLLAKTRAPVEHDPNPI